MEKNLKHLSKFISLVLRHKPEEIGLELDANGWADTKELIRRINEKGEGLTLEILKEIVETNDKKRFAFNEDHSMIRASQGHSIDIELGLEPVQPPEKLYHGTAEKNLASIMKTGIASQSRQHVHLSATTDMARQVGTRHGKPVVLTIDTAAMYKDGHVFFLSANKVWLTHSVPLKYIAV
jgi:putative RNA 2'-phosphotransferase